MTDLEMYATKINKPQLIKNIYGDRYMCKEYFGTLGKDKFSALKIWPADDCEDYASEYINAINGPQPNIWEPYRITANAVQVCEYGTWYNYTM